MKLDCMINRGKRTDEKMRQTRKLLSGAACSFLLAISVLPVEAAVTKAFVSISPQKYFVQKIGGDLVDVSVLVPAGANPHNFEPKPRQMAELSKSAVYFAVGIDFEKFWLKKITAANPKMRVVRTDDGIAKIPMGPGPITTDVPPAVIFVSSIPCMPTPAVSTREPSRQETLSFI